MRRAPFRLATPPVAGAGFGPAASRLSGECSPTELPGLTTLLGLAGRVGFEPTGAIAGPTRFPTGRTRPGCATSHHIRLWGQELNLRVSRLTAGCSARLSYPTVVQYRGREGMPTPPSPTSEYLVQPPDSAEWPLGIIARAGLHPHTCTLP
jgi:hypothetical protein